jgi:hypothetical protein
MKVDAEKVLLAADYQGEYINLFDIHFECLASSPIFFSSSELLG